MFFVEPISYHLADISIRFPLLASSYIGTLGNACAAVRLDAKRLLIIGGSDDSSELDSTELLDLERP